MDNFDNMLDQAIDQAKSDEALSDIDVGYIKECLSSQIDELLTDTTKKNYLKKLEENLEASDIDDQDKDSILTNLYNEVIDMIAEKFEFSIDKTELRVDVVAKALYKFFVLHYQHNVTCFIEAFIMENQKTIFEELNERDGLNNRHIEGVNSKISLILNNIPDVIEIIDGTELSFDEIVGYVIRHDDAKSHVTQIHNFINSIMSDTDEIPGIIMRALINEDEGFSSIYTDLQLRIFKRFND